jgi:hypothetical protein
MIDQSLQHAAAWLRGRAVTRVRRGIAGPTPRVESKIAVSPAFRRAGPCRAANSAAAQRWRDLTQWYPGCRQRTFLPPRIIRTTQRIEPANHAVSPTIRARALDFLGEKSIACVRACCANCECIAFAVILSTRGRRVGRLCATHCARDGGHDFAPFV